MNIEPHTTLYVEPSGLHAPYWFATEQEYCKILYWLIRSHNYKDILELGTFMGHTAYWWVKSAKETKGHVVTIDFKQRLKGLNIDHLSAVESTTDAFFASNKRTFDFIYVDAGHTYEEAKKDILNAHSILKPGGAIAVHDTGYSDPPACEVDRALEDAKKIIGGEWIHLKQGKGISIGEF